MDELFQILLKLNRVSRHKAGGITYAIRLLTHYNMEQDGIGLNFSLLTYRRMPRANLPTITFNNINELKSYLLKEKGYWERYDG